MKKNTLGLARLSAAAILVTLVATIPSCKSKKNMAQVSAPQEEIIEEEVDNQVAEQTDEENTPIVVEERKPEKIVTKEQKLNNYFKAISAAASASSANSSIEEALTMFSSSEAPVLIVIYNDGSNPDYDEPTTIEKYLNYLKDTKTKPAEVEEVVYTSTGKIKELVLKK